MRMMKRSKSKGSVSRRKTGVKDEGEERAYKKEQSAMWQGADGARKKRFTLWLLAVSSSLLRIHWQRMHAHTHLHGCMCARTHTNIRAASLPVSGQLVSFHFFFLFPTSAGYECAGYQAMSSRYPTTISTLLEENTISKLKCCSFIHKGSP